ncbi:unnamed protein product, partial [Polarella glacialis]
IFSRGGLPRTPPRGAQRASSGASIPEQPPISSEPESFAPCSRWEPSEAQPWGGLDRPLKVAPRTAPANLRTPTAESLPPSASSLPPSPSS